MDLRQFTTTPSNNFDGPDQRRTSISSMSSAQSGYASSAYGGAGNQTPSNSRFGQAHYFGQGNPHQQQHVSHGAPPQPQQQQASWLQHSGLNVTPWIEQQAQVNSNSSIENQTFVDAYGNNINGQIQGNYSQSQNYGQQQQISAQHLGMSQSMQASFDSQSTRVSPSSSNVMPSDNSHLTNGKVASKSPSGVNSPRPHQAQNAADSFSNDLDKNDNHDTDRNDNNDSNDNDENDNDNDDELIPTAIVIKNIPFAIKKEQLLEVMTKLNLPLPYAFNYHFDNGVFRGLAFANFTSTDETTTVVTQLNGREIGGRKLRVEYKKMLPLAERERIEREKREKRGQLEEQHRSTSNASLASMISIASAPSGSKPLGPAQLGSSGAAPGIQEQPLQPQHTASERYYAPIPFVSNLPIPPSQVDFNDAETLEFYSQLLFFRDDREKLYTEIAYPASLSQNHRRIITVLAQFLGLAETYDNTLILIKRRNVIHDPSPIIRTHSHSSIPLLNQPQGASQNQRFRQQGSVPQQAPNRIPPNFSIGMQSNNNALSSAALLRNNPTPTRVLPNLYNNSGASQGYFQQQPGQQQMPSSAGLPSSQSQQAPQMSQSQPTTPGLDSMSRFNLQSGQWDESYGSSGSRAEQELNDGLNSLNLGLDNGSNIWGTRSVQPTV